MTARVVISRARPWPIATPITRVQPARALRMPQLWAFFDDPKGETITTFWSLEDALHDTQQNGQDWALLRTCELAFPNGKQLNAATWAFLDGATEDMGEVACWSDYSRQDDDICEMPPTNVEPHPFDDLQRRLAVVLREWALAHGAGQWACADVDWGAWNFTGPRRRFELAKGKVTVADRNCVIARGLGWIEVCPECQCPVPALGESCEVCR